jgi:hypothetical protein
MPLSLGPLFEGLPAPNADHLIYSVAHIPGYPAYFIGKDNNANACLLIAAPDKEARRQAPIRLESLEATFDISSVIKRAGKVTEGTFTVVRCRSNDTEIVRYFLSVGETLLRILGPNPNRLAISDTITRLAHIFQRLQSPAARSVNGLFGELFLIRQSQSPFRSLAAWRTQDTSRFDFNTGSVRIDVKTAAGRQRIHTFSYDQCNPPSGTTAVAASLFVEQAAGGVSLQEIIREIEGLVATNAELVLKLHDTVAETLGRSLSEALRIRFDHRLSASSLQFYDLRSIPAIRAEPPHGVSDIHFRSDLSSATQADTRGLVVRTPSLADFLPEA